MNPTLIFFIILVGSLPIIFYYFSKSEKDKVMRYRSLLISFMIGSVIGASAMNDRVKKIEKDLEDIKVKVENNE
jgi:glucan phosphoethanolaminetransferase (alkaline phosphatase superfamily)